MTKRVLLLLAAFAAGAAGQAISTPSQPTSTPNQVYVTTGWLYANKMRYAGAWSASTVYNSQDLTTYNGASYISLAAGNQGNIPSSSSMYWVVLPGSGGGGAVSSVFGRTGAVVAQSGDYSATDITGLGTYTDSRADARIEAQKAQPSGLATLDLSGKLPSGQLTQLAITDTYVVASQAAQLALAAHQGDIAIRTDQSTTYVQNGGSAGTMADWTALQVPASPVNSVNGYVGNVSLSYSDVGAASTSDARLSNARTPTAHAASHAASGGDPITPASIGAGGISAVFDGATTSLADGSSVVWSCNTGTTGSGWVNSGAQCTTTWTVPTGVTWVRVVAWSGGGGGDGSSTSYAGFGGAGGGYWDGVCPVTPGSSVTVAVGLGGAALPSIAVSSFGGDTSFGSCFTLLGGMSSTGTRTGTTGYGWGGRRSGTLQFGWIYTASPTAMLSNVSTSCLGGHAYLRVDGGGCMGNRATTIGAVGNPGGDSLNGGAGGGGGAFGSGTTVYAGGAGGTSFGGGGTGGTGGGYDGTAVTACTAGSIPGGGGGGAPGIATAVNSGCAGARGEVRIFYAK